MPRNKPRIKRGPVAAPKLPTVHRGHQALMELPMSKSIIPKSRRIQPQKKPTRCGDNSFSGRPLRRWPPRNPVFWVFAVIGLGAAWCAISQHGLLGTLAVFLAAVGALLRHRREW